MYGCMYVVCMVRMDVYCLHTVEENPRALTETGLTKVAATSCCLSLFLSLLFLTLTFFPRLNHHISVSYRLINSLSIHPLVRLSDPSSSLIHPTPVTGLFAPSV